MQSLKKFLDPELKLSLKLLTFSFFFMGTACSSFPLKKSDADKGPYSLEMSLIPGNYNVEKYKTKSDLKVYKLEKSSRKKIQDKTEKASFELNRKVVAIDEKGRAQFQQWITDFKGQADLPSMGFPPQGSSLQSIVSKNAKIIAVKNMPEDSIFYLPRISLPEKKVKLGELWPLTKEWRSLQTGWPFVLNIKSKIKAVYDCGGITCFHISYTGYIKVPKNNPVKQGVLKSAIEGEFLYSPTGHQFIWSYSSSKESFFNQDKEVVVRSCTSSYQINPARVAEKFVSRHKGACN